MQISVPLYHAQAIVPVLDSAAVAAINTAATQAQTTAEKAATELKLVEAKKEAELKRLENQSYLEKYVLYPAIRVLIFTLIQTITNQTVAWIKGDEGGNVGFVKNLEQNAYDEANARAGEMLSHIAGINLCSVNLQKILKIQLTTPFGDFKHLNAQLQCTLTGIVDNVDHFYQNFNNGGWPAFVGIAVNSQNNAVGAGLIAELNFQAAKGSALDALKTRISTGSGFQGVTLKKKSQVCEWLPDVQDYTCYTQTTNTTPGAVVSDALNTSLNHVGIDIGIAEATAISNAVDAAITAIINALAQRLFKESKNLF